LEVTPSLEKLSFDPKYIPVGGFLSGFFGHQGALRTAFLIRAGLKKEVFIGSMVVSAVVVDISRLIIYGSTFFSRDFEILKNQGGIELVLAGTLAAFLGAFIGSRLLQKITMRAIQATVGVMNFPDHDFDIAMVSFGLHELSYSLMVDMLKEMHRALKPLAKLFIVDYEREKFGTP
jgi:SAM-dependent methyltransferase